jgi:hypothetical protein
MIQCRVSGLSASSTYFNSAVARAAINNEVSRVEISDSSNNGSLLAMDPNNDGNPGGPGENEPTPFSLGVLPVRFLAFDAVRSGTQALLDWRVATPVSGGDVFRVEYSTDGRHWLEAGRLPIVNGSQSSYRFIHAQAPASVTWYRIVQWDTDGSQTVSVIHRIPAIRGGASLFRVTPNPAQDVLRVYANGVTSEPAGNARVEIRTASGQLMFATNWQACTMLQLPVAGWPAGIYYLHIRTDKAAETLKVSVGR